MAFFSIFSLFSFSYFLFYSFLLLLLSLFSSSFFFSPFFQFLFFPAGDKARNSAEREDGDSSSRSIHKTGGSATNPQPLLRDEDLLPSLEGRAIDPNFSTSFMAAKGMVGTEARRGAGRGGKVTKTISPVSKGTPATAVRKGSSKVGSNPGPANSASLAAAQMDKLFASLLDTEDDPSPSPVVNALPPLPSPSPPVPAATAATPSTVAAVTPIEEGVFSFAYLEGVKEGADPTSTPLDTSSNLPVAASPEMAGKEKEDKEAAEEGEGEVAAAIAAMKVVDLKEKCREMKLPVGGKKAELQDRILHALGVE